MRTLYNGPISSASILNTSSLSFSKLSVLLSSLICSVLPSRPYNSTKTSESVPAPRFFPVFIEITYGISKKKKLKQI